MAGHNEEEVARLLEVLKTRVPFALSSDEVRRLETEAWHSALANKLLAAHHFNDSDLERARACTQRAFAIAREPDTAKSLLVLLAQLGRFGEALAFADEQAAAFEPIELQDGLCWINWRVGRYERSRAHGLKSLALKDAESAERAGGAPDPQSDGARAGEERVISFCLFGDAPLYLDGAVRNCIVARHLYPDWTPRFYVDDTVPTQTLEAIAAEGARVQRVEDPALAGLGTFWRFLVEDDPAVGHYVVRDCDAVINIKERVAVEDWLASGLPFHVMRDHPTHSELILAGLWGAHRGRLGPMRERILRYTSAGGRALNDRRLDQRFLRHEIWPRVKAEACVHDGWFAFGEAQPYRAELTLPRDRHIGQNDGLVRSADRAGKPDEV